MAQEWVAHGLRDKIGRIILITFGIIVIVLFAFLTFKIMLGYHMKILGSEFNPPDPPTVIHDTIHETRHVHDTVYKEPNNNNARTTQKNKSGKNEVNENKGNNYGNIGGQNNTVNNNTPPPREIHQDLVRQIAVNIPSLNTSVHIFGLVNDPETISFKNKIYNKLLQMGYRDVNLGGIYMNVEVSDKVTFLQRDIGTLIVVPGNKMP